MLLWIGKNNSAGGFWKIPTLEIVLQFGGRFVPKLSVILSEAKDLCTPRPVP